MSSIFVCSAACADMESVEGNGMSASSINDANSDSESALDYGWEREIKRSGMPIHSLREIVTEKDVVVRKDGQSCVSCHSWAGYQDRISFCARVDEFLGLPTATGDANIDEPNAKPAALKKLLEDWKEAGCPN